MPDKNAAFDQAGLSLAAIWIIKHSATFKTSDLACACTTPGPDIVDKTLMSTCQVEGGWGGPAGFFLRILTHVSLHRHLHFLEYFSFSG